MKTTAIKDVDNYIASFSTTIQKLLKQMRSTIKKAAPQAEEYIGYQMPAYKLNGPLVYFGGYENHIGFYPTPGGIKNFEKELITYKTSKGAIQFPVNEPLPVELITKIVQFRIKENEKKISRKSK